MNLAFRIFIISIILTSISLAQTADSLPKAPDRWFARDKIEHFSYSVFCAAATAKVANRHFEIRKERSLAYGVGVSFSLGILKEGIDFKTGKGTASKKDFIWDIAGTITGALLVGLTL